mgnify:CR=1 FL=1
MDAVHHLSIDIETYSDQEIGKAGLYRYAQSPAFAILLFAYSLDGGPVQVVDLTRPGAHLPVEVIRWLFDPACIKHAYNAAFEWYCLSRFFHLEKNKQLPAGEVAPAMALHHAPRPLLRLYRRPGRHRQGPGAPTGQAEAGGRQGIDPLFFASPASPPRATGAAPATFPGTTRPNGSSSRITASRT